MNDETMNEPSTLMRKRLQSTTTNASLSSTGAETLSKKPRLDLQLKDDDMEDKSEQEIQLENFRKEAIWREMRDYRRKFESAQRDIEKLQFDKVQADARLASVDLSWNLLVREADLLLPSTSTASNGHSSSAALTPSVSDRSLTEEQLDEALAQRSVATKSLLARLQSLHPSSASTEMDKVMDLELKCRTLLEEAMRSQESLRLLRTQHAQILKQLDDTRERLSRADKKLDRLQSSTVASVEGRQFRSGGGHDHKSGSSSPMVNGDSSHGVNGIKAEDSMKPSSPLHQTSTSLTSAPAAIDPETLEELQQLRSIGQMRAQELDELRGERVRLKNEVDQLRAKLVDLPEEVVAESTPFKLLQSYVQALTVDIELRRTELDKVIKESETMREGQEAFRASVVKISNEQVEELQKRLLTKETDLSRIRAQREDLRAEASELKARDGEKFKCVEDLRTLAQSREDRIVALSSEVRRFKMARAAKEGDLKRVELHAAADEEDLVKDLSARLEKAETLLLALRDQLHSYAAAAGANGGSIDAPTIAQSEMDARKELSEAKAELVKMKSSLGFVAEDEQVENLDVSALATKLQTATEVLKAAEAQLKSNDQATNMLYSEIDRLSAAWSTLDEQQAAKTTQLHALEEKVHRSATEKTKADNRYFQTMRQKEALVAENAVLTKLADKQNRAIEASDEAKHAISDRLTACEKEISSHQRHVRLHQDQLSQLRRENGDLTLRHESQAKALAELQTALAERVAQAEHENAAKRRAEEQLAKLERELANAKAAAKTASVVGSSYSSSNKDESTVVRELKSFNDDLSKMLKCSTCSLRFKSVIINRCCHLFCKDCIDARLANRQRKCPTCGIAFGKDDVSTVYF